MHILADIAGLFGLSSFKSKPDESLSIILSSKDTFVSLSMGYSNFMIYAALPYICNVLLDRTGSICCVRNPAHVLDDRPALSLLESFKQMMMQWHKTKGAISACTH